MIRQCTLSYIDKILGNRCTQFKIQPSMSLLQTVLSTQGWDNMDKI